MDIVLLFFKIPAVPVFAFFSYVIIPRYRHETGQEMNISIVLEESSPDVGSCEMLPLPVVFA